MAKGRERLPGTDSYSLSEPIVDADTMDNPLCLVNFTESCRLASTFSISAGDMICCGV